MENVSTNVCAKFCCTPLHIKKALGIFRELITMRTTRVAFGDPPSGSKKIKWKLAVWCHGCKSCLLSEAMLMMRKRAAAAATRTTTTTTFIIINISSTVLLLLLLYYLHY